MRVEVGKSHVVTGYFAELALSVLEDGNVG